MLFDVLRAETAFPRDLRKGKSRAGPSAASEPAATEQGVQTYMRVKTK